MNKPNETTEDFTLFEVAIVKLGARQYPVNAAHLHQYYRDGAEVERDLPIEKIPSFELVGRRICGVSYVDGKLVLALATKSGGQLGACRPLVRTADAQEAQV